MSVLTAIRWPPSTGSYSKTRAALMRLRLLHRSILTNRRTCKIYITVWARSRRSLIVGVVNLPVTPPVLPMLAKRIDDLPTGQTWIFEPKWDGFRALIFRDRDEILIQSRDSKSLNRYFPELLEPIAAQLPARCVLDGEIVVAKNDGL